MMEGLSGVFLGCALGGMARFWLSTLVERSLGGAFPWGTVAVNVSGAFAVGLFAGAAAWVDAGPADIGLWRFVVVGFLGSYTTVSSFSLQTLLLVRSGDLTGAAGNVALSLALCLGAATLGMLVARGLS